MGSPVPAQGCCLGGPLIVFLPSPAPGYFWRIVMGLGEGAQSQEPGSVLKWGFHSSHEW